MPRKIDYSKIEFSNALVLNFDKVYRVKFLDDGMIDEVVVDKENDETTESYVYSVLNLDNNKEYTLSIIQSRLLGKIIGFENKQSPKGKSFQIRKIKTGLGKFDVDYEVQQL